MPRERERERKKVNNILPKKVSKAQLVLFLVFDVMEMFEMKRCAGMWVYRRDVASFKR